MNKEIIISIALEIGIIVGSVIASFILPGLGGILFSGMVQLLGDIGLELYGGGMPSDPLWYITEFLSVFGPYFQELKAAKLNSVLLRSVSSGIQKVDKILSSIDDVLMNTIEMMKKQVVYAFKESSGLPEIIEQEVQRVEQQEIAREKFGQRKVKITKKINSFVPNTKNPFSWIAGVGFKETARLGPRDIRGDLVITYYINNQYRVGFVNKLMKGKRIILGRTSSGVRTGDNQSSYRKHHIKKDMSKVKVRKVVFKGARYYNDYLAFLKAFSWGGYYMRKWMIGLPGRKSDINSLIVFGDAYRVYTKFKSITGDFKDLFSNPDVIIKAKASELFGQTRLGSKYNKYTGYFSKAEQIKHDPFGQGRDFFKGKAEQFRDNTRTTNIKKKRRR